MAHCCDVLLLGTLGVAETMKAKAQERSQCLYQTLILWVRNIRIPEIKYLSKHILNQWQEVERVKE